MFKSEDARAIGGEVDPEQPEGFSGSCVPTLRAPTSLQTFKYRDARAMGSEGHSEPQCHCRQGTNQETRLLARSLVRSRAEGRRHTPV